MGTTCVDVVVRVWLGKVDSVPTRTCDEFHHPLAFLPEKRCALGGGLFGHSAFRGRILRGRAASAGNQPGGRR